MTGIVPPGFEPIDMGTGFGDAFGPAWIDRAAHRMGFIVGDRHANPFGMCHGGAMATFADSQIMALRTVFGPNAIHCPTINLSIDYLAPAPLGTWVESAVKSIRQTRTMLFTQAIMTVDGEPVARSSAIYRIRDNRSSA